MPGFDSRSLPATDMCRKCAQQQVEKREGSLLHAQSMPHSTQGLGYGSWRRIPSEDAPPPSPWAKSPEISARRRQGQAHCHKQQMSSAIWTLLNIHACRWELTGLNTPPEILPQACPGGITAQVSKLLEPAAGQQKHFLLWHMWCEGSMCCAELLLNNEILDSSTQKEPNNM